MNTHRDFLYNSQIMDTPAHGRKMDRETVIDNTIKQNTGIKTKLLLHVTTGMNLNNTV